VQTKRDNESKKPKSEKKKKGGKLGITTNTGVCGAPRDETQRHQTSGSEEQKIPKRTKKNTILLNMLYIIRDKATGALCLLKVK
jgi:hypothetical protein